MGAGHFQYIIGDIGLNGVKLVFVILVDLPYHCLHGLPGAGVLTGKENTKAGTNDQPDQADNDDDS